MKILGGLFKGRLIKTPKTEHTRPTQSVLRAAVFNICQNSIDNARVLDLFAGSGAVGFEALSRGAAHVTFVEKEKKALECIRANIAALDVSTQTTVIPRDINSAFRYLTPPFDLIYVDPPYALRVKPIILQILSLHLLSPHATLFIEEKNPPATAAETFPNLSLISVRHFGDAALSQWQCAPTHG